MISTVSPHNEVDEVLDDMSTASDTLLAERALLRRTDTKFVLPRSTLAPLLHDLRDDYAIVLAGEARVAEYHTIYFDSVDHFFLVEHLRGRRPRFKVRMRHYVDRRLSYLEVKEKTPGDQTVKARLEHQFMNLDLSEDDRRFVDAHSPVSSNMLTPSLWTRFNRLTLVGIEIPERITLDLDLRYEHDSSHTSIPDFLVAEVKQPTFQPRALSIQSLRDRHARMLSFSKYCTGASLLIDHPRREHLLSRFHGVKGFRRA